METYDFLCVVVIACIIFVILKMYLWTKIPHVNQSQLPRLSSVDARYRPVELISVERPLPASARPSTCTKPSIAGRDSNTGPIARPSFAGARSSELISVQRRSATLARLSSCTRPATAHLDSKTDSITRLSSVGARSNEVPAQRLSSSSTTPSSQKVSCERNLYRVPISDHRHVKQTNPTDELRSGNKDNRSSDTPINIIYPSHPYGYTRTRHYTHDNETCDIYNKEDDAVGDLDDQIEDSDEQERDEECEDEKDKESDEEDDAACLDLRGLFVREAIAAVEVFLPREDQRYADSGFLDSRRFVNIITGWGKLSPGQKPKLKPAVEELLNSTSYKLKYTYEWTNDGEMRVDLIRRKTEYELRNRSEERMKQKKKNRLLQRPQ